MTGQQTTLILTQKELSKLLNVNEYIEGIGYAFHQHGEGKSFGTSMVHGETPSDLEFHIKAGGIFWKGKPYYALKANGSSFKNRELRGLPNILGAIILYDGESGFPLAVMESVELTRQRTAAGTVVALKLLAPANVSKVLICGCGAQGRMHLKYLTEALPISEISVYDLQPDVRQMFARAMREEYKIPVSAVPSLSFEACQCQVIVTCTPSRAPYLRAEYVSPGTTIAAVGSDSPVKQELDPQLLKGNKVIVDVLSQCASVGELHHALSEGLMTEEEVYAEIGDVITGRRRGRETSDEIIIYDATGTAIQDAAAAILVYEKAIEMNIGFHVDLFA